MRAWLELLLLNLSTRDVGSCRMSGVGPAVIDADNIVLHPLPGYTASLLARQATTNHSMPR
jgi:hypothetical protein